MRIAGVDPGLRGAVAVIDTRTGEVEVHDIPSLQAGAGERREYHVPALVELVRSLDADYVFIERQHARPENPSTAFKVGVGYGLWQGILAVLGIPYVVVSPQIWQRAFLQGDVREGKDWSVLYASRLYPALAVRRHDQADALLIATYGRRQLEKEGLAWHEV